jgi:hypothetical protein
MRSTEKLVSSWAVMRSAPQWASAAWGIARSSGTDARDVARSGTGQEVLGTALGTAPKAWRARDPLGEERATLRDIGGGLGRSAGRRRARKLGFGEVARTSTWKHWGWSWEFQSGSVHHTELCWEWYWKEHWVPYLDQHSALSWEKGLGKMKPAL